MRRWHSRAWVLAPSVKGGYTDDDGLARSHYRHSRGSERKALHQGNPHTVYDVLEYLAGGMTEAQILADFTDLTAEDIRACLAFAASRERRLSSPSAV